MTVVRTQTFTPRRERKKAEVRRRIVRVALDLFARHGLESVTVDHIADMADLGKGTIYNYFPAKEDIVVAFMVDLEKKVQAKVARLGGSASLEGLLTEFLAYQFRLKRPYHAFVRVFLGQMFMRTAALTPYLIEMQKTIDPNLDALFRGARQRGFLREDVDLAGMILVFKTIHLGLTGLWAVEGPPFRETHKVLEREVRLFCEGLEARS